ncbi:FecR family protein [Mucilaginibacter paludis]|uniref:Anti-FecI sigma factor, FecR n=1 Tax=Mucilaginibacter paludis DSM 18603 TaxID=714943 RepID=H1Y4T8_9SPHI|nr:FecR family protein [Mucilaginibacter paludis]EHQ28132.1 anti-FecI sigma factor, FecR [Mucilaginibacter paludis DSM 18603]
MKDTDKKLLQLLNKRELSIDDKRWLLDYIENTDQKELLQILNLEFNSHIHDPKEVDVDFPDQILAEIYSKAGIQAPDKPKIKHLWAKRLAVASTFAGLFLAVYFGFLNGKKNTSPKYSALATHVFKNDIKPGCDKAILTLSNGKKIILDSARNGVIASQGSSVVIKSKNGALVYNPATQNQHELVFNTIATPRGGRYQVALPDGSQAWLNAASSIRFPTSFNGKERVVEITGEAYFEVAKNKEKPFIVKVNNSEIRVLGTHFNVNAYADEATIKTTLLEGAVQFTAGSSHCLLKPGQQSELNKNGQIKVIPDADMESALAWKNGMLHFEDVDISFVMRQLSRWYDIDVVYHNKTSDHFFVDLTARSKLSDVLKMMELTGRIKFDIQGKTVVVN